MRLLSFELPGLSGWERGCGRIELWGDELALKLAGVGITDWRNPPASSERYSEVIARPLVVLLNNTRWSRRICNGTMACADSEAYLRNVS